MKLVDEAAAARGPRAPRRRSGSAADGGITRKALSREDADARAYVAERMRAAGLEVRHDEVGNLRARRKAREARVGRGRSVMTGSHLDTVPSGGQLDGPLGVVGAVAAVEALDAAGVETEAADRGRRVRRRRGLALSARHHRLGGDVGARRGRPTILELRDPDGIVYRDALAHLRRRGRGDSGARERRRFTPSSSCTSSRAGCSRRRSCPSAR